MMSVSATDVRWLALAARAQVMPGIVAYVGIALAECARSAGGSLAEFDPDGLAAFAEIPVAQIAAVVAACEDRGFIREGVWVLPQSGRGAPLTATERQRRRRARLKAEADAACSGGNVTSRDLVTSRDIGTATGGKTLEINAVDCGGIKPAVTPSSRREEREPIDKIISDSLKKEAAGDDRDLKLIKRERWLNKIQVHAQATMSPARFTAFIYGLMLPEPWPKAIKDQAEALDADLKARRNPGAGLLPALRALPPGAPGGERVEFVLGEIA